MTKTYELPKGRSIVAEFDENGVGKITIQALDSLICELNEYAERQSGKWDMSCTCSVCGQWRILESEKNSGKYKYCPNCGCRMVEPQESEDKTE